MVWLCLNTRNDGIVQRMRCKSIFVHRKHSSHCGNNLLQPPFHPLSMMRHRKIAPALLAPPLPIIPEPSQWDALSEATVSRGWQPPHLPGSAESRDAALPFGQPPPPPYPPPCEEPQQKPPPPTYPPPEDVELLVRHLGKKTRYM